MPSGIPSSVRHSRATDAVLSLVSLNPGRAPAARAPPRRAGAGPAARPPQPCLVQAARPLVRALPGEHVAGQPDREPRLADTARAAEGQSADLAQQPGQLGQITLAADEA